MPTPPAQLDAFLSYSREDEPRVRQIQEALQAQGFALWRDGARVVPGDSFIAQISSGLEQSRCLILFNSASALASQWVSTEWNAALALRRRIIVVRMDGTDAPAILRATEWVDLQDSSQFDAAIRQIADGIRGAASGPAPNPASGSNPSVVGQDRIVLERMIEAERRSGRNLERARAVAAVIAVALVAAIAILGWGGSLLWIAVMAAGVAAVSCAGAWAFAARLRTVRLECARLDALKNGIELYCPNQPPCLPFRVKLEAILKQRAGISEGAV